MSATQLFIAVITYVDNDADGFNSTENKIRGFFISAIKQKGRGLIGVNIQKLVVLGSTIFVK